MSHRAPQALPFRTPPSGGVGTGGPTLVVGLDGTEPSWSAFSWACGEALRLNGRVIAVYVSNSTEKSLSTGAAITCFDAGGYAAAVNRAGDEQAAKLKAEAERMAAELCVELCFLHLKGDAADRLKRIAHDSHADVIAVGRSTKLRHRFTGSLGRRLMRDRSAPIVVIVP